MSSQRKINLLFFLVIFGFIVTLISISLRDEDVSISTQQNNHKQLKLIEIKSQTTNSQENFTGIINAEIETDVIMKVSGKIDNDNRLLNPGSTFKKNDILIKVDRIAVLYDLLINRLNFKKIIQKYLPEISNQFPTEQKKWQEFEKSIIRTLPLPDLPKASSEKEESLITKLNIYNLYYEIKRLEQKSQDYIYVAPFDGFITESNIAPNSMVKRNKVLMRLSKSNSLQVTSHIPLNSLKSFQNAKEVYFVNLKKDTIATGGFKRIGTTLSDSSKVEVFFSLSVEDNLLQNSSVQILLPKNNTYKHIALPKSAILKNSVYLFSDNKIIEASVKVIDNTKDSVYVTGLPNHCFVISEAASVD